MLLPIQRNSQIVQKLRKQVLIIMILIHYNSIILTLELGFYSYFLLLFAFKNKSIEFLFFSSYYRHLFFFYENKKVIVLFYFIRDMKKEVLGGIKECRFRPYSLTQMTICNQRFDRLDSISIFE